MDRILYKEADGDLTCRSRDFERVFPTLYAYEETGLTPEQITDLKANLEAMTELARDLSDKLEQVKQERDVLAAELKEERHRHDRYVDFELAEAEKMIKLREEIAVKDLQLHLMADERNRLAELWAQVPATIKSEYIRLNEFAGDNNVSTKKEA